MVNWPTDLPLPLVEYSGEPVYANLASPDESLHILRRSRFTKPYYQIEAQWVFRGSQFYSFEGFFLDELNNGTSSFLIPLRFPKESQLTTWRARFLQGYEVTIEDLDIWRVTAPLWLINPE